MAKKLIDTWEVIQSSLGFANRMIDRKPLSAKFIKNSHLFKSSEDVEIVINLIIGALTSYHDQLRLNLLEHDGIDIGDFEVSD